MVRGRQHPADRFLPHPERVGVLRVVLKEGDRRGAIAIGGRQWSAALDHIGDECGGLRDRGRVAESRGEQVELLPRASDTCAAELLPHPLGEFGRGQQGQVIAPEPLEQRRIKARGAMPETRRIKHDRELRGCRGRQRRDRRAG